MDKTLIFLLIAVAFCSCNASIISTQFHSQDGHGGYSFGHSGGPSTRTEHGAADGTVSGTYSYVDGNGIVQTAIYAADPVHGFTVQASNLPVAPKPVTPVLPHLPVPVHISAPVYHPLGIPVLDTPEVASAKLAHLAAVEHQKLVIASHPYRKRRDVSLYSEPPHAPKGFSYHTSTSHHPIHYVPIYHYPYPVYPAYHYPPASHDIHDIPVPVTDTPEVAAAKSAHLSAVEHAKTALGVH